MDENKKNTLTLDDKEHDLESLSDQAKTIVSHIQFVDQELNRIRMQNNALQTARQAYVTALKKELEGEGGGASSE